MSEKSKVVSLGEFREKKDAAKRPNNFTFQGKCKCLACGHTWIGVAEAGTVGLECSACGCARGVFMGDFEVPESKLVYTCTHCDSQIFMITENGSHCLGCGWQDVILPPS